MTRLKIGTLATNKILGWHSTPLWSNLLFKFFDSGWFHTQISKWRLSSWRDAAACTIGQRKRTVMQTTPPTKCFVKVEVLICFVIGQGVDIWSNNETSKWQALWITMVYYGILSRWDRLGSATIVMLTLRTPSRYCQSHWVVPHGKGLESLQKSFWDGDKTRSRTCQFPWYSSPAFSWRGLQRTQ